MRGRGYVRVREFDDAAREISRLRVQQNSQPPPMVPLSLYEQAPKTWAGGSDLTWTLDRVPALGIIFLFADRGRLVSGVDYTLTGNEISIINGPLNAGAVTTCVYFYW